MAERQTKVWVTIAANSGLSVPISGVTEVSVWQWGLWCPARGLRHASSPKYGLLVPTVTVGWQEIDNMSVVSGHPVPIVGAST